MALQDLSTLVPLFITSVRIPHSHCLQLFAMLFYPADTVRHFLMPRVYVPTCYSVVPGNARWNLAFNQTCEQDSFYHEKESTQGKRRGRKKEHLVNKRYVTFLCSSLTGSPLHFWKLMGALVFYHEPGSGRQAEQLTNSSQGLLLFGGSDKTTPPTQQCRDQNKTSCFDVAAI